MVEMALYRKGTFMDYKLDCRLFTGYKPCIYKRSCDGCDKYDPISKRILIISLEAMGAVLRTTCILEPIKRAHPNSHITWLTLPMCRPLLDENPYIDRILAYSDKVLPILKHLRFDSCMVIDKSLLAGSLAHFVRAEEKKGFGLDEAGAIIPLDVNARYQYDVGLDDELKFHINQKPETQQITETLGLEWRRDSYILNFSSNEKREITKRREALKGESQGVIGFSTGCSKLYPYKKFTVERSIEVVAGWRQRFPNHHIAIFGGPEDKERNLEIAGFFSDDPRVLHTPTDQGLRSGLMWMATSDLILSGCSLGLHIAIALKKKVVTWFGVSCSQEIDLYDRGIKLQADVSCSPCWKKSCDKPVKCYDKVDVEAIMDATEKMLEA